MNIDRKKAEKVFLNYVDKYDSSDKKIKLKIDHTMRVAKICHRIATGLKLSKEDIDIAYLTGLLHDIGRFEQIKRYGTFNDAKSIDHAKLGVEILFKENKIRDFIDDDSEDELIKQVIDCHNAYKLPEDFSENTLLFANILRDADKIDIFRVNATEDLETVYGTSEEELYNSIISQKVMKAIEKRESVLRSEKETAVDSVASHIAFVFDMFFQESIKITKEQGYIEMLLAFKSNIEVTNNEMKKIGEIVHLYMEERINGNVGYRR